ncbi:MAG: hypothetical protein IJW99_02090 [Clostridia bacterium]|nr:hypothetical protein [Clostridia bacterium]
MKHIIRDFNLPADPHTVILDPDFTALDKMYEGRTAYYGDYHVHSNSGGTSDGKTTPEEWLVAMKELGIDFVGLMDHRQVRHQYLDCFDPKYFLYGSEPAGLWHEPHLTFHYLMIFQDIGGLERVLEKFPDVFEFEGGVEGHFKYIRVDYDRFEEVKQAVLAEGGAFVHAHPMQQLISDNLNDYNFGDGIAMEIIYCCSANHKRWYLHTAQNYELWMKMLAAGMKMPNTATSDAHGKPHNKALNTVYTKRQHCADFVQQLRAGDLNSGYMGIKMCIGDNPVGSTMKYEDGMQLLIKVDDAHPQLFDEKEIYYLNIITDEGLAYSAPITLPFERAIEVKPRKFYRAEIMRQSDGFPAAIGNPIWMEK